jgi:aryl-alcohol dehydrogenase-like predicted oxidoreductase
MAGMRTVQVEGLGPVSKIGLGTWQFGSREWGYGPSYAEEEAGRIVRRALELGVTLFDTAEMYAFGASERILGSALGERRRDVILATKLFPVAPVPPVISRRARGSARRLGVDRIDLYQVHWPNPLVPLSQTMRGMRELLDDGVVGAVGVSNFDLARWQAAEEALGRPVVSNQVQYSLVKRDPEGDIIPWAEAHGRLVLAYSPLAQGLLSGHYDASRRPGGVRAMNPLFLPENLERARGLLGALREVATAHAHEGATPAQVALAWAIRSPAVVAIPGASSVSQLESNVRAAALELTEDEVRRLSGAAEAFEAVMPPRREQARTMVTGLASSLVRRARDAARPPRGRAA